MLVVSRKLREAIRIDDEIKIEVVEIRNGRVKIGVNAPVWMNIQRDELLESDSDDSQTSEPHGSDRLA